MGQEPHDAHGNLAFSDKTIRQVMISVAMATYNGEKYLREQIDSILNQTINDIELVVCDDCSADNTASILKEYADKDRRVRYYVNPTNLGLKKNFYQAVSFCQGELVAFSDQDDIWMPNHLELLQNALGDKIMSCGNADIVDENGTPIGMTLKYQDAFDDVPEDDLKKAMTLILFRNPFQGASMLFRKELVEMAGPVPDGVGFHDEWLAAYACFVGGINYVNTPILKWRRLKKSVTGAKDKRRSKIRAWRIHHIYPDRIIIMNQLMERVPNLTRRQLDALRKWKRIYLRNQTYRGKILNMLYKLLHYRTIYSCDIKHWI